MAVFEYNKIRHKTMDRAMMNNEMLLWQLIDSKHILNKQIDRIKNSYKDNSGILYSIAMQPIRMVHLLYQIEMVANQYDLRLWELIEQKSQLHSLLADLKGCAADLPSLNYDNSTDDELITPKVEYDPINQHTLHFESHIFEPALKINSQSTDTDNNKSLQILNPTLIVKPRVINGDEYFNCTSCDRKYRHKKDLQYHMLSHTSEKNYNCDRCELKFYTEVMLRKHRKVHTITKHSFACEYCNRTFALLGQFKLHMNNHIKPFECYLCKRPWKAMYALRTHMRQHTGEMPYECGECLKRFSNSDTLRSHVKRHGQQIATNQCDVIKMVKRKKKQKHLCNQCGKSYTGMPSLNAHMRSHVAADGKPFACDVCDKRFKVESALRAHVLAQHNDGSSQIVISDYEIFPCSICDRKCLGKSKLDVHMKIHSDFKEFECDECDRRFHTAGSLKLHKLRRHSDEKPFPCNLCSRAFKAKVVLKRHMRIHTGEKPYGCDACDKRFPDADTLKVHKRIHTGEKPATCDICGRNFIDNKSMKKHRKIHLA